jgi:hypothetical protein
LQISAIVAVVPAIGTKKREVFWGGRIIGAEIRAEQAREAARKAQRDADRRSRRRP